MHNLKKLHVNPDIVLREEFDDWAILFDPNTGKAYGINPVSVLIWKNLDGKHTIDDLMTDLKEQCNNIPDNARDDLVMFLDQLVEKGFAGTQFGKK